MSVNTNPIFPVAPKIGWGMVANANTSKDGTGTQVTVFTAGANGSKIDQIKVKYTGSTIATVLRFFVNNGSSNATPANNAFVHEITIPPVSNSEVAAQDDIDVLIPKNADENVVPIPYLPAGYKINVSVGTTIVNALDVSVFGGDF